MDWEILGLFSLVAFVLGKSALLLAAQACAVFSTLFSFVAAAAAFRMLGRRGPTGYPLPPVTILKPLKGEDRELYANLASFCVQDYPSFQILFAVSSPDDPALGVIARLRDAFPSCDIEVVVSSHRIGWNPKINNIANAYPYAKHQLLLLSDSDIRVAPDFLRRAVAPFRDPKVGLASCFYRSSVPSDLWGIMEAHSVNAQFLPQALAAGAFGMRFAMGAAILVRREVFDATGGFRNLADHLADDFALGASVAEAGYRVEFCEVMVESVPDISSAAALLKHQTRWSRTIRICNPAGYCGSVLLHGFSLSTASLAFFGWDARLAALMLSLWGVKALATWSVSRAGGARMPLLPLLLLPLSEWLAFAAWLSGFRSNEVLWRGQLYTIHSRGRLVPARGPLDVATAATVEP
ncbi:MAG: bacteriohopanetetrol glucosamine biosynthesis glycosyltransferase HpnI [Elusimicrobiota bacterium]